MLRLLKFFPLAVFLLLGGIAVLLWQEQNDHRRELIFRHTASSAEQIQIRMEGLMQARMASLELLASRWVERVPPDFSRNRFLDFAENFYTYYPGFMGINWADSAGVIRWVYPLESNRGVILKNIREQIDSQRPVTFQGIRENFKYTVTPCGELWRGGIGFDTFWPLIHNGKLQGYLNGVFEVKRIAEICFAQNLLADFCARIYEADRLIFTNEDTTDRHSNKNPVNVFREIRFPGKVWRLELIPTAAIYAPGVIENLPLLVFGFAVSFGISLLLHFLLLRMQLYRQARNLALRVVTERELAEKALRDNEKKLEALLAELSAKNEELETFVFTVSHDLKTPVVTIEGFIGALREDFGEMIPADGGKYLQYISDASHKIGLLINDLLELSRIGRISEAKTTFPFSEIVGEALKSLQYQIEQRGIRITIEKNLPLVHGEKKRLVQVLENLLSNAVKYIGNDNPAPCIEIGVTAWQGGPAFFVRDNGIGIDNMFFDKIFGIFQRLPEAVNTGAGTGVGLTIIKRIVERHGGRVWLESEVGKGTTFYFTLNPKET
ncbi:MAG: ATP-binding protein [Desulfobacterales bacterium]|jgi:signal transduction histidine kinase|nr:ATP-binding protein [Desulfobacterales bacterium]